MTDRISRAVHEIATADAWKVFAALLVSAVLMVVLMPITRFGFVLAALFLFGWLSAIARELAKANGMSPRRVDFVGVLGFICALVFAFPYYLDFEVPKVMGVVFFVLPGLATLGCMCYLVLRVGPLLAMLESKTETRAEINGSVLAWIWPVGVWFLQPRLQRVLLR